MSKYLIAKWVIAIVVFGYLLIGCFPFAQEESDSTAIANGADYMVENGIGDNFFAYRYHAQPGAYVLITWFSRLTGLPAFISFSILALFASIGFIFITVILLSKFAEVTFIDSFIFILLFQEIFAETYYPSSNVIAGFTMILAFLLFQHKLFKTKVVAALLYALAVWIRFDVLLTAPFFILHLFYSNPRRYLKYILLIVCSIFVISKINYFSHLSFLQMFSSIQEHMQHNYEITSKSWFQMIGNLGLRCHLSFLSVFMIIAFIGGMIRFAIQRRQLFYLTLIGLIPFYIVFFSKITTPKYLYYYIPLFILPALVYMKEILSSRKRIIITILSIVLLQYLIGIRINFHSKPLQKTPYPTVANLGTLKLQDNVAESFEFVLGAGIPIPTDDLKRLSTGILFAPIFWNHQKKVFLTHYNKTKEFLSLNDADTLTIVTTRYSGYNAILQVLINTGYYWIQQEGSEDDIWKTCILSNGRNEIVLHEYFYPARVWQQRDTKPLQSILSKYGSSNTLFFTTALWERYLFNYYFEGYEKLSEFAYFFDIRELKVTSFNENK